MSEIHIGPHTRDEDPHGSGETRHTYDREIDLKSIAKWMAGLLVVTLIVQVLMWWLVEGIERFDEKQDPELTPIQQQIRQPVPPEPRLQVNQGFEEHVADAISRSDLEDMQLLRAQEDKALATPSWIDQGQGRVRVPIDVAMQVIASRGAAAAPAEPLPGAPAQPGEPPAGTTQQQAAPQPPAQEQ